ncbi:MAG: AAA family ATPase [Sphingobacteriaceae bacterium]|nr:AAA family ATPase [Sphingobacteriaceae bacterium]
MNLRKAERQQARIRMGLQGPSGSGKTMGALLVAYGITSDWNKIAVIDTENNSADLYAHLGPFNVLSLSAPYSPERYIQAVQSCEQAGMEVIIIDSISHEWEGTGGILETHSNMIGNSFTNWSKLTPRHNQFINAMLSSKCHVIGTIRSKQDYVLAEKNGKMVPEKVGLKGVQREGMDYELTLVLEIDIKQNVTATKDRTGLFMNKPEFKLNSDTGIQILEWCKRGIDETAVKEMIERSNDVQSLREIFNSYPEFQVILNENFQARKKALVTPPETKPSAKPKTAKA